MRRLVLLTVVALALSHTGCAQKSNDAGRAVERYLQSLVAKDSSRLSALSCAEWEQSAQTELDSFQAVDVKLQDAVCATSGSEGGTTLVSCQGKLVATYGGEDQELDLATRTYEVVQQGGDWLVCGER
jgi:hypothetical protein